MTFIGQALVHVLTWHYIDGFMAALLIGCAARMVWRLCRD